MSQIKAYIIQLFVWHIINEIIFVIGTSILAVIKSQKFWSNYVNFVKVYLSTSLQENMNVLLLICELQVLSSRSWIDFNYLILLQGLLWQLWSKYWRWRRLFSKLQKTHFIRCLAISKCKRIRWPWYFRYFR